MRSEFAETLCRIRKEGGFPTAYRFFYDNGGEETLGFSYRQYLRMEQGKSLPRCDKLHKIISGLRLTSNSRPANALAAAWLKTLVGEQEYLHIFEPLLGASPLDATHPMHTAVKTALASKKHYITPGQFRLILSDPDTFLCFTALQNDTGIWSVRQVAESLRLTENSARAAMRKLAQGKLLRMVRPGAYRCHLATMMIEYPRLDTLEPALRKRLFEYQNLLTGSGTTVLQSTGTIRADIQQLRQHYFPLLLLSVSTAETYNITKKTGSSALFHIESKIVKLRDF